MNWMLSASRSGRVALSTEPALYSPALPLMSSSTRPQPSQCGCNTPVNLVHLLRDGSLEGSPKRWFCLSVCPSFVCLSVPSINLATRSDINRRSSYAFSIPGAMAGCNTQQGIAMGGWDRVNVFPVNCIITCWLLLFIITIWCGKLLHSETFAV